MKNLTKKKRILEIAKQKVISQYSGLTFFREFQVARRIFGFKNTLADYLNFIRLNSSVYKKRSVKKYYKNFEDFLKQLYLKLKNF